MSATLSFHVAARTCVVGAVMALGVVYVGAEHSGFENGATVLREGLAITTAIPIAEFRPATADRREVRSKVEIEARRQGVPVELAHAVAHVESRHRCDAVGPRTRHGRAQGPLQILPGSARALGFDGDPRALSSCGEGLRYGMKHLAKCWEISGRSYAGAATCHVQGWGRDPNRPVNAYARQYRGWVLAQLPAQPDASGWLTRGSVAAPWANESARFGA